MLQELRDSVLLGDIEKTAALTAQALNEGLEPAALLNEAMISAMDVVGSEYESGIRYIPEMLISAEAMKAAMEKLRPLLAEAGIEPRGRIVIGTVEGDLHDIGKNLVGMMLEGAGFDVIDLGVEIKADRFVEAVRKHKPQVLAISALLTTTMTYMPAVIQALQESGLRDGIKIMVGGAPVTQEFADRIGADGFAPDAPSAAALAARLIEEAEA